VWNRRSAGKTLTFHLAGINNQNFIMRDQETGSYWQQISGQAVAGPLKGSRLEFVRSDEVSFGLWRSEHPATEVLAPIAAFRHYYERDWEPKVARLPSPDEGKAADQLPPREVVIGVAAGGEAKAYPFARLEQEKIIEDRLAGIPIAVVLGPDNVSIRVFRRMLEGREIEMYRAAGPGWRICTGDPPKEWTFAGCGGSACLEVIPNSKEYWFDWRRYHPDTRVYRR
jgi:hypothetical protein